MSNKFKVLILTEIRVSTTKKRFGLMSGRRAQLIYCGVQTNNIMKLLDLICSINKGTIKFDQKL